ncbi:MAG: ABC transporter ATP-binding protein [Flavobacteriales bacterium]|nr:ABC transporter ATP-binding protein [Flavobacteriales bacterium]
MSDKQGVTGKAFDIPLLLRVLSYVKPYKSAFYFTTLLTVILAFFAPIRPWLIKYTIDKPIAEGNMQHLILFTILMVALLVIESVMQFYQTYSANKLGQDVIKDLRIQLFRHILSFRLKYFDRTPIGTLVTRTVSDIETISDVFAQGIIVIIGDILQLLVVVIFMFLSDWKLTLISLVPVPFLVLATFLFKKVIKSAFQEVRTHVARLNAFVQEHITGMSIVQMFNREKVEMEKFKEINKNHMKAHIKTIWAYSVFFPVVELLAALSLALLVWWGTKGVVEGYTSFGNLVAFILYIYMLYRPIRMLADRFNTLQMGMVSSERVFKVLDTKEEINNSGILSSENIQGEIEFKNVWFAYNKEEFVLKDISFRAEKGKTLALIGATGAGKTSVISLLGRFYEYNQGEILIDGKNIREYELYSYLSSLALVPQEVFLFSDTIYNNITLHNSDIPIEEVQEAAKKVGAHEFIMKLPENYFFNVRERGAMLSVGQRQLISFIRAYVHKPKILILDEATSSIDTDSENLIQHATKVITQNRTSIIVAHRLSTIQNADKILVFDNGKIVEEGNHLSLLNKEEGYYKKLYELQFKNSEV